MSEQRDRQEHYDYKLNRKGVNMSEFSNRPPFVEWCDRNIDAHKNRWAEIKERAETVPGVTFEAMQAVLYTEEFNIDVNVLKQDGNVERVITILENG